MPYQIDIPIHFVRLHFHEGGKIMVPVRDQEALQFQGALQPVANRFGNALQKHISKHGELEDLLSEFIPGPLFKDTLELAFPASKDEVRHPEFKLEFDIYFNKGPKHHWGFIPALGLENIGNSEETLKKRLEETIRTHFSRNRRYDLLQKAIAAVWFDQTELLQYDFSVSAPYPWESGLGSNKNKPSWLSRVAKALDSGHTDPICFGREKELEQLERALRNPFNKSTIIIGDSGVGKTALVEELARRQGPGFPKFWETTAARLIKELSRDRGWQDNIAFLIQEIQQLQIVLYVRNLKELFEIGQYEGNSISLAEYLLPAIGRGEIILLSECTGIEKSQIERKSPGYFSRLQTINLAPLGDQLAAIIKSKILLEATKKDIQIEEEGIEESIELHKRFFPYGGEPGQSIRFMENLVRDEFPAPKKIDRQKVVEFFSLQSGIPAYMIDSESGFAYQETIEAFSQQVYGQSTAIEGLVDMLGAVKSHLIRPDKPIASFLFLGPTGVGKTELAKVLAEFMFGDRNRIERFDMSEFSSPMAVNRLIGAGNINDGLLTGAIRRTPFCVLLFDELEKAHNDFFDLLLQILGEGRLTGKTGQNINFCSTIIIMTSNIGAQNAQQNQIRIGKHNQIEQLREHYLRAVKNTFRPELFNRIDRIIPFDPLSPEIMRKVVDREIKLLLKREGIANRKLDLNISETLLDHLAIAGYDSKMGARQLQRTIRDLLIVPLAKSLNEIPTDEHLAIQIDLQDGEVKIDQETDPLHVELWLEEYEKISLADHTSSLRRNLELSRQSNIFIQFLSDLDILDRRRKKNADLFWKDAAKAKKYSALSQSRDRFDELQSEIEKLEHQISLACLGFTPFSPEINDQVEEWRNASRSILLEIYQHIKPEHDHLNFKILGENLEPIVSFYESLIEAFGFELTNKQAWFLINEGREKHKVENWPKEGFDDPRIREDPSLLYGWQVKITGPGAYLMLGWEDGTIEWELKKNEMARFSIMSSPNKLGHMDKEILSMDFFLSKTPKRIVKLDHIKDQKLGLIREYGKEGLLPHLSLALREAFNKRISKAWTA